MTLAADDSTPFASRRKGIRRRLISLTVMALVNLLPILGFLFSDWNLYELMALYWAENVIIGVFTLLKMLSVESDSIAEDTEILTAVPSFLMYFAFCLVQAMLIQLMFQKYLSPPREEVWLEAWQRICEFSGFIFVQLKWVVLAMVLSHGFSYVYDYNLGGEKYRTSLGKLWFLPAARLIVMTVVIMVLIRQLEAKWSPMLLFTALIALKIVLEWLFDVTKQAVMSKLSENIGPENI